MSRGTAASAASARDRKIEKLVTPMASAWWAKIWISAKQVIPSAQNSRTRLQRSLFSPYRVASIGCADR